MLKKVMSVMLAIAMLLSVIFILSSATASALTDSNNGCIYYVDSNGIAVVTGYSPKSGSIGFTTTNIGGYTAYRIADGAFKGKAPAILGFSGCISIGKHAFEGCSNLRFISLNSSLTEIGAYAFRGCTSLAISVPAYARVDKHALGFDENDCKIEGFTISGYTGSYAEAYANYHGFEFSSEGTVEYDDPAPYDPDYEAPDSEETLPFNPSDFPCEYEKKADGTLLITKITVSDSEITIPAEINGMKVTEIADEVFMDNKTIEKVVIPSPITKIGERTFKGSTLKQIELPDTLKSLDKEVFADCVDLESIFIPKAVNSIDDSALTNCSGLKTIEVAGDNNTFKTNYDKNMLIRGYTLYRVAQLTDSTYTVPGNIRYINNYAFSGDKMLETVIIPDSVQIIYPNAFAHCSNLTDIRLPEPLPNIAKDAFFDTAWYNAQPDGVLYYEKTAFSSKGESEQLTVKDGTETIAVGAFIGLKNLKRIKIADSVAEIGTEAFKSCDNLEKVKLGNSLQRIKEHALFNCKKLNSIYIPASVVEIETEALGYYWDSNYNTVAVDGFTIYGYPDTEAQRYAEENGFTFIEYSGESETLLGDADGNGDVDTVDATIIQRRATHIAVPYEEEQLMNADIDGDGSITIVDATFIQRYTTKVITPYPIGEPI